MSGPPTVHETPPLLRELQQQAQVVQVLRRQGIFAAAVPNGHIRNRRQQGTAHLEGVVPGMPDLLVFLSPPALPHAKGVALEMKRATARSTDVKPVQRRTLGRLRQEGWVTLVGYGAADALAQLHLLGYDLGYEPCDVPFPRRLETLRRELAASAAQGDAQGDAQGAVRAAA